MRRHGVAGMVGAAALVTACSSPTTPAAAPPPSTSSSTLATTTATTTATTSASPSATYSAPATEIQGRVLFSIEAPDERHQLAYIDGSGLHLLPRSPHLDQGSAVWDGPDHVVFVGVRHSHSHIYRMALDGSGLEQLSRAPFDQDRPAVSPDGRSLVWGAYTTTQDEGIHVVAADGSRDRRLTPVTPAGVDVGNDEARFSPDGRSIAYVHLVHADQGLCELWVMSADGSSRRRLTSARVGANVPEYSPDGRTILFTVHNEIDIDHDPLRVISASGGPVHALVGTASDGGAAWQGDWSPDGRQIVYMYYERGWNHNELRIADADGSHVRTLWVSPTQSSANQPDWAG